MTTKELIAHLNALDPSGNLEVTETRCSDVGPMDAESWMTFQVYRRDNGEWFMRDHYSLTDAERSQAQMVVHFNGN